MIEQVPLVGEKTAKAIVAHRQRKAETMGQRGEVDQAAACRPIQNCEEMLETNGGPVAGSIGKDTLESLMCFATL
jgi:Holliday junction resolvasome RuvABC DNA-binding subunit